MPSGLKVRFSARATGLKNPLVPAARLTTPFWLTLPTLKFGQSTKPGLPSFGPVSAPMLGLMKSERSNCGPLPQPANALTPEIAGVGEDTVFRAVEAREGYVTAAIRKVGAEQAGQTGSGSCRLLPRCRWWHRARRLRNHP